MLLMTGTTQNIVVENDEPIDNHEVNGAAMRSHVSVFMSNLQAHLYTTVNDEPRCGAALSLSHCCVRLHCKPLCD